MIAAKVYNNTTQWVPDNPIPAAPLTLNTVQHDPANYWQALYPTRFTVPPGMGGVPHMLWGSTFTAQDPATDVWFSIFKNGSYVRGATHTYTHVECPINPGQPIGYISTGTYLDPNPQDGDYYELRMYIDNHGYGITFGISNPSYPDAQTTFNLVRLG